MATIKNVELFKAGTHTDSSGRTRIWTQADLLKISGQYDPEKQEAPAVIGHPKDTAPAYGWVKDIWVDGDILKANFEQVAPEFETALKEGRYKKRSISLNKSFQLQHVAFLGGAAPAVNGLKDIKFSSSSEFETYEFETTDGMSRENDNMELAQALAEIERLKDEMKKIKDEGVTAESATKLKNAEDKAKAAEQKLSDFTAAQGAADLERRVDTLVKENKLLPGDKDKTLNFAKSMTNAGETMDFSIADGKTEKVSPREAYLRDLESAKSHGLTEEFARSEFVAANSKDDDECINFAAKM